MWIRANLKNNFLLPRLKTYAFCLPVYSSALEEQQVCKVISIPTLLVLSSDTDRTREEDGVTEAWQQRFGSVKVIDIALYTARRLRKLLSTLSWNVGHVA